VPDAGSVATIGDGKCVELDVDAVVAGVIIDPGAFLVFRTSASATLESSGNVLVRGEMEMKPSSSAIVHTLRFIGVDMAAFVGGGMDPLPTDVGLWVMDGGVLDLQGTEREAWNRTGTSSTWIEGDELVVTPTASGAYTTFDPFNAGSAVPSFAGQSAEVLNLTRNVNIEGTPDGRSHVFMRSVVPQSIRYVAIRYMGPRQGDNFVLGRYGLHFHHAHDGSRGSIVEGVVVRDTESHSFVPHMANGITFKNCIAYNVMEDAFWWDPGDPTDDTLWEGCVAAHVRGDENRLTGYFLGLGDGNMVRGSVAVGVQGGKNAAGFSWPEGLGALWGFENNVSHNNATNGSFVWQNSPGIHRLGPGFVAYRNGKAGIEHGAYNNRYHYSDMTLIGNEQMSTLIHAVSKTPDEDGHRLTFERILLDGAGTAPVAVDITRHNNAGAACHPAPLVELTLTGYTEAAVRVDETGGDLGCYDFVRTKVGPELRDLEAADFDVVFMHPDSVIRVQSQDDGSAYRLTTTGSAQPIAPFDTGP
jgi:hypothetical protein